MNEPDETIDLVDRLVAEYADRLARGEDPRREELLARAPAQRAELERCFRMLEEVEGGAPTTLAAGLQLGDFRLGPVIGRGGMAVVYEAEQVSLRRAVALKVLRAHLTLDEGQVERFQREARAAARLAHANVVPIHAVGRQDGHAFIAFELVRGPTLERGIEALIALGRRPTASDLARASGAPVDDAPGYAAACARLLAGVFAAIAHAHRQGVIHRDLKPSNILLTTEGKPLVADFGLAKDLGEASLSLTGEALGTPHYMAPEQARAIEHPVDARTDVYALGVTLYELLTLERPFRGETWPELVHAIVSSTPRSPCALAPDLPAALGDVVLKAMAKEPGRRYASVDALAADLERALRGESVQAESSTGLAAAFGGWLDARMHRRPFEYRSRRTLLGLPWLHIVEGVRDPRTGQPRWARGVVAMGSQALGVYAGGGVAVGLLAFGGIALGPIAIGALALGFTAVGGLVLGWKATAVMAIGARGRGLMGEWLLRPDAEPTTRLLSDASFRAAPSDVLVTSIVCIVLGLTMLHGWWSRACPDDSSRSFLRRMTRLWMPLGYLLPFVLSLCGVPMPFPLQLVIIATVSWTASIVVKHRLGRARQAHT